MQPLRHQIEEKLKAAFTMKGFDPLLAQLSLSRRPDLSDYQCNGALIAAKKEGKNPLEVANTIVEALKEDFSIAEISLDGPGFINFKLFDKVLADTLGSIEEFKATSPHLEKVIVDYGGPNVAKPLHVGHLRSSIIGECIKRLLRFCGHQVIGDIHLGDWGTQMGMMIIELQHRHPDLPYFNAEITSGYPEQSPVTLEDLQEIYPIISAKCKESPEIAEKARHATYELQNGRPGYRALWQHFVDLSIADMKQHFGVLGVEFDQWFGESRYQAHLEGMIAKYQELGIAEESEGALIVPVAQETDKKELPPLLLRKSDGAALYATTDLATIEERVHTFKAEKIVYVVDMRQSLHFEQVFRAAKKAGIESAFHHVGYGTMNGPDGKPFKTRQGGVMQLGDLISMLKEKALERVEEAGVAQDLSDQERASIAEKIGIAALKFADLQHDPSQNYQFDLDKFMQFEGKTGPYLLYAVVRIKSILRKAHTIQHGPLTCSSPAERKLMLHLLRFEDVVLLAHDKLRPNLLCEYAFELAQSFSNFYQQCPILKEEDKGLQSSRLTLCAKTLQVFDALFHIIGLSAPEKM